MSDNFNPRPPRGGRLISFEESPQCCTFQSTPPARGATAMGIWGFATNSISIHAPREGGDGRPCRAFADGVHFNPRPPRGGRLYIPLKSSGGQFNFNPRPPRGGRHIFR